MSQQVIVSYQNMSARTQATCEYSLSKLCKIDELLDFIHNNSSRLIDQKVSEYEKYLINQKKSLQEKINNLIKYAKSYANITDTILDNYSNEHHKYIKLESKVNELTASLSEETNDLVTSKLYLIEDLLNMNLINVGKQADKKLFNEMYGVKEISSDFISRLSDIEDISLREFIYLEALKVANKNLSFEELVDLGKSEMNKRIQIVLETNKNKIISEVKEELIAAKVDSNIIEEVMKNDEIHLLRKNATVEIIDERVRKDTLRSIMKTIEKRGFIVDRKNVKIDRDLNEVKMVALKASGEKAEFKIYLDGKFIYKFDGYEGQACQKDIEPFIEDLENIYGVKVIDKFETWRNPDKLSKMHYQTFDVNKDSK